MNKTAYRTIQIIAVVLFILWSGWSIGALNAKYEYKVEKKEIPFDIKIQTSDYIRKGWTVWLEDGKKGYKNQVKEILYIGSIPIKQNLFYETEAIVHPKKGFVLQGTSEKNYPITVPENTYVHYIHDMEATAYDPSPESNSPQWAGITSLGWRTRYGIAAVDPRIISMRSLIFVEGYGFAWTGDIGGDIKGRRIDLCYNTTQEALNWGRRKVKVYVLGKRPLSYYRKK
ncbi:MAG: 3D domain-containing protein [Candidatus Goldiibacteriota bacterium]